MLALASLKAQIGPVIFIAQYRNASIQFLICAFKLAENSSLFTYQGEYTYTPISIWNSLSVQMATSSSGDGPSKP